MSRIFVTTDTHGCAHELKAVLELASFSDEDTLIHLGDCVDRGPDSKGVIDILLSIKNLIAIKGNHDDWLLESILSGNYYNTDKLIQGQLQTLTSYQTEPGKALIPDSHIDFLKNQKLYYIDKQNRLFVHAGYNRERLIDDPSNEDFMFYWDRSLAKHAMSCAPNQKLADINDFKRVFIGHTSVQEFKSNRGNSLPLYKAQVVLCDTGVAYGGKLSLIDITDDDNHKLYQV